MRRYLLIMVSILALLLAFGPAHAQLERVNFQVAGKSVTALIALPGGPGPHIAVIYNHGGVVREKGYNKARALGYDAADYAQALADAGYIGLAPIREHLKSANYRTAIIGGVETVKAAIGYLKSRPDVDKSRMGAIGFSEGGLVTLWAATRGADLSAVVLMSPATIRDAGDMNLREAVRRSMLAGLTMPVMLTVGSKDNKSIRKVTAKKLIPIMQKLEKNFTYKIDYPGDHKWFWKVRKSHFADVKKFLDEHLK